MSRWTILHEVRRSPSGIYVLARCQCGREREVLRHQIASGQSQSCGCRKRKTPAARFWSFVDKGDQEVCWEWRGTMNKRSGYGKFWLDRKTIGAHRASYLLNKGPIPDGLMVRHTCDNKRCVNPGHLLVGTAMDNSRDAVERDLCPRGVANGTAKLTPEQVGEIKRCWAQGETQVSLARRFGVSRAAVQWILKGKTWSYLSEAS